jgi:hypothetical protein
LAQQQAALASVDADRKQREAEARQAHQDTVANQQATQFDKFAEQATPGGFYTADNPNVQYAQRTGRTDVFTPRAATPDQPMVGPLEPGQDTRPTVPGTGAPGGFLKTATQKQQETAATQAERAARDQQLASAAAENMDLRRQLGQGMNDLGWARVQAMLAGQDAKTAAAATKTTTLNPSAEGKRKLGSLDQSSQLTDKILNQIRQQYPDIETNPDYNTVGAKSEAAWTALNRGLGFAANDPKQDARLQMTDLLKGAEAGQYGRGSSQQFVQGALQALPDKTQTLKAQYDRLKNLKSLYPELAMGIIHGEQPIDLNDPLKNYSFGGAGGGTTPPAGGVTPAAGPPAEWVDIGGGVKIRKKQ